MIGTDPSADLCLSDPAVAAFQCEILATTSGIDIVDLLQRSNTLVNEVEVSKAHLRRAVTISVGNTDIRFERVSASLHVARSSEMSFGGLIGSSVAMRELFSDLKRIAASEMPVMILGEAGCGKEDVARSIHSQGHRRAAAFHSVDCTASHQEIEGGLIKAFESAAGGTLYLEQIGEMPSDLQSRMLRVFNNGGPGALADLRIISSCSSDLRVAVNEGRFDSQLYGYLRGEQALVPPMRSRQADLPRLVASLLEELDASSDPMADTLRSREVIERFRRYSWPGNVKELREHLSRSIREQRVVATGVLAANVNESQEEALSPNVDISRPIKAGREEWIKHFERMYLTDILESQGGNVTRAAKAAGVDRGHFYRLMMRCGMRSASA